MSMKYRKNLASTVGASNGAGTVEVPSPASPCGREAMDEGAGDPDIDEEIFADAERVLREPEEAGAERLRWCSELMAHCVSRSMRAF